MQCPFLAAALALGAAAFAQSPARLHLPADRNPLASTAERLFPLPSRFFQRPDPSAPSGYRSSYPDEVLRTPAGAPPIHFAAFDLADGHSPCAPLLVHLGVDVGEPWLAGEGAAARTVAPNAPIALIDLKTGRRVPLLIEMDRNLRGPATRGRHALILRPLLPMAMGHRHVAVITTEVEDARGRPLATPPGFAALRDSIPTDHEALEAARAAYEEIFARLERLGYPRERLRLAFDFMVASRATVLGGILSMRDQALERAAEGLGYRVERIVKEPDPWTAVRVEGSFEAPWFLDPDGKLARRPDGTVAIQEKTAWFPFTLTMPRSLRSEDAPPPLVLFGHGIFGSGRRSLRRDKVVRIADRCKAALIATDFIGLSRGDRALLARELLRDLNRIHVMTDRLQQALVNHLVLTETAVRRMAGDERLGKAGVRFDPQHVYYYGVSLGGTLGASLVALSPRITRAFLAVPGGAWSTMLSRSIVFKPFKALVDSLYGDPLLQQAFVSLLQARYDGCDAANLAGLLLEPSAGAPADRRVLFLEAIADCQVPNLATRIVARAAGACQVPPMTERVFGLPPARENSRIGLAQILMPERVAAYRPPDADVMPQRDNGTHYHSVFTGTALALLERLMLRGRLVDQEQPRPRGPARESQPPAHPVR